MPEVFTLVDPNVMPEAISDRQFGEGLWHEGVITYEECERFVSVGEIPKALQDIIDLLPDDDTGAPTPRKTATVVIKGAKEYRRHHPLTDQVRVALGMTPAELDARWLTWSRL